MKNNACFQGHQDSPWKNESKNHKVAYFYCLFQKRITCKIYPFQSKLSVNLNLNKRRIVKYGYEYSVPGRGPLQIVTFCT